MITILHRFFREWLVFGLASGLGVDIALQRGFFQRMRMGLRFNFFRVKRPFSAMTAKMRDLTEFWRGVAAGVLGCVILTILAVVLIKPKSENPLSLKYPAFY